MHINLIGTINLLEAFRLHAPAARILVVTSAEIYGREPAPAPIPETAVPQPANPYAVSKLGADSTARLFARRYDMPIITARPGNHIGPGQSASFVASSFAHQLAAIAQHRQESVMHVGNLDSERDFTDVRDVVRAYRMLLQKGVSGHAYNIASGHRTAIRDILDGLCRTAGLQPEIRVDPERWRPADTLPLLDITRIREQVGWMPRISLAQTLDDIYRHVAKGSQQGR
jgi:GDP-4-dehydro-6-deoxy-D-mannose reductase